MTSISAASTVKMVTRCYQTTAAFRELHVLCVK